jgi:hypothetical protein
VIRVDPMHVDAALAAVERVLAARPDLPHALAIKADLKDDLAGAARVRALVPGRADYTFIEARLRTEARDFGAARRLLAPLLTPGVPEEIRDAARRLMSQIEEREKC